MKTWLITWSRSPGLNKTFYSPETTWTFFMILVNKIKYFFKSTHLTTQRSLNEWAKGILYQMDACCFNRHDITTLGINTNLLTYYVASNKHPHNHVLSKTKQNNTNKNTNFFQENAFIHSILFIAYNYNGVLTLKSKTGACCSWSLNKGKDLKQNEAQSIHAQSTHKGVN